MEPNYTFDGTVVRVIDADTLVIDLYLGMNISFENAHIRVKRFDAPEPDSKAGKRASKYMDKLLVKHKNKVTVRTARIPDRSFERYVAEVYVGGVPLPKLFKEWQEKQDGRLLRRAKLRFERALRPLL